MNAKHPGKAGESIIETLISVLIVAVTFSFLTGAVVSSFRVNTRLKGQDITFQSESPTEITDYTIEVYSGVNKLKNPADGSDYQPDIHLYQTENGYYYYEAETTEP